MPSALEAGGGSVEGIERPMVDTEGSRGMTSMALACSVV